LLIFIYRAAQVMPGHGSAKLPAAGCTYWAGEAMRKLDYNDAGPKPDTTGKASATLAANTAHLAQLLSENSYPAS
jgi:hypothetical protein